MTGAAWATLIGVGGFVWGGFLLLVAIAMRKERRKPTGPEEGERGLWVP